MKKLLTTIAAFAFVASAAAQTLASYDFEDGTAPGWQVWNKKELVVADKKFANNSNHALTVAVGVFFDLKGVQPKMTYVLSADAMQPWADREPGTMKVEYYDPKAKKLVTLKEVAVPADKTYKNVKMQFKSKVGGYHRVTFIPNQTDYARYYVDNVKVEKVEK